MGNRLGSPPELNECNQSQQSKDYHLQMKYCFFKLLQHRDWTSVKKAISSNPILAAQRDTLGCTTLHMTCSLNPTVDILFTIYRAFPDAVRMTDGQGRLPIHVAIIHGAHVSVIQSLISFFPESVDVGDCRGQLPIHHLLLSHTTPGNAHPNAHPSSRYEYHYRFPEDLFHLLLQADFNLAVIRRMDFHGYTPLALGWESYRSVVPWNEQELEERKSKEWNKLETMLYASYQAMQERRDDHDDNSNEESNIKFPLRRIVPSNWKILHAAVGIGESWCPIGLFQLLIEKVPEQVMEVDENENLPLIFLLDKDTALKKPNRSFHMNISNKKESQSVSTRFVQGLLQIHPQAARIPHSKNQRLPLHLALSNGRGWFDGVKDIFMAYPEAVTVQDPVTGCLPFLMPAVASYDCHGSSASLNIDEDDTEDGSRGQIFLVETMYNLLLADPSILQRYLI